MASIMESQIKKQMNRAWRKVQKDLYLTVYRLPNARSKSVRSEAIRFYELQTVETAKCMVSGMPFLVNDLEAAHMYMECWPELPVRHCGYDQGGHTQVVLK